MDYLLNRVNSPEQMDNSLHWQLHILLGYHKPDLMIQYREYLHWQELDLYRYVFDCPENKLTMLTMHHLLVCSQNTHWLQY